MHKKILRWQRDNENQSLPYGIIVACVYAEKCDPKPYFKDSMAWNYDKFIEDCSKQNQFHGSDQKLKDEFKNSTGINIDDLISSDIWVDVIKLNSINDYLKYQDFDSQQEIKDLCKKIFSDYLDETCFDDDKKMMKMYGKRGVMYLNQMRNLGRNVDAFEKWAEGTANQFWFGNNAVRCISKKVEKLFRVEQADQLYKKATINLIEAFRFSNLQIEMLKYFICQSKEGNCPASLNKAIYIWGKGKGTGKTTIAATLVSILNGEENRMSIGNYESTLAQELGYVSFVPPMIASCRAVMLDEAMPKDSTKSYGTLKNRITSNAIKFRFIHKNQVTLYANPNYVFTSNDPLIYSIADESERRFFEFCIDKKYMDLTDVKIYELFLKFAQQCKRDKPWQQWYDEMATSTEVKGMQSRNKEDIRSYFESDNFYHVIRQGAAQVSIGTFYVHVAIFDKLVSKKLIRECVIELFGEPYRPSTWRKSDLLDKINIDDCPY